MYEKRNKDFWGITQFSNSKYNFFFLTHFDTEHDNKFILQFQYGNTLMDDYINGWLAKPNIHTQGCLCVIATILDYVISAELCEFFFFVLYIKINEFFVCRTTRFGRGIGQ